MLPLGRIADAPLALDPFKYFIVRDFLDGETVHRLSAAFPKLGGGSYPIDGLNLDPVFARFVEAIEADAFRDAIGAKLGLDLHDRPIMMTLRGNVRAKDGAIHTDSRTKIVTVLIYLNEEWTEPGGRLRLLRSPNLDDYVEEIAPTGGNMIVFERSDRSFHGHLDAIGARRSIQVNWVTGADIVHSEIRRHKRSAFFKRLLSSSFAIS